MTRQAEHYAGKSVAVCGIFGNAKIPKPLIEHFMFASKFANLFGDLSI